MPLNLCKNQSNSKFFSKEFKKCGINKLFKAINSKKKPIFSNIKVSILITKISNMKTEIFSNKYNCLTIQNREQLFSK